MTKTQALRKVIAEILNTVEGTTYYWQSRDNAQYPFKVYTLQRVDLGDLARDDYDLCVDLYDRSADFKRADALADAIESAFNNVNHPDVDVLPTFFRSSRYPVMDNDKEVQHIQLHFDIQNYERI